jgi:hypothetical protein
MSRDAALMRRPQHRLRQRQNPCLRLPLKQRIKTAKRERADRAREIAQDRGYERDRARRERAYLERQRLIAEREELRAYRRELARRALFIHGVSHGPLDDPLGPYDDETLSEYGRRVDLETPKLTWRDFKRGSAKLRLPVSEMMS